MSDPRALVGRELPLRGGPPQRLRGEVDRQLPEPVHLRLPAAMLREAGGAGAVSVHHAAVLDLTERRGRSA